MKDPTIGILFACLTGIIGISMFLATKPPVSIGVTLWVITTVGVLVIARCLEKRGSS